MLDTLTAAYLQRNLRPQIQTVTVHPPGEVFQKPLSVTGETEILGLEAPLRPDARPTAGAAAAREHRRRPPRYSRKLYQKGIQTFSWKAEDPNGDTLAYDVHYRPVGDTRFRLLRKGADRARAGLGHLDGAQRPLRDPGDGHRRARQPGGPRPDRRQGERALRRRQHAAHGDGRRSRAGSPPRVRAAVRDDSSLVRRGRVLGGRRPLAGDPPARTGSTTRSRRPTRSRSAISSGRARTSWWCAPRTSSATWRPPASKFPRRRSAGQSDPPHERLESGLGRDGLERRVLAHLREFHRPVVVRALERRHGALFVTQRVVDQRNAER